MIKRCDCRSEYQDKKYGNGMRVHNPTRKGTVSKIVWRCTICKKEQ